ncbi:hypothetical protein LshimejAT787_0504750 [Lyophyllum shimeji]|uniref:Uncharacterized protein n=1 Tax=Lyophyllum shimeji TaxID=47721 RepID=A0A9P3PLM5_LYOSH|nr:hypothetical protein LshimejAT787_0504750 [Lyophyllum shimeji]
MTSTSTAPKRATIPIDSLAAALTKLGVNVSVTALLDAVEEEEANKRQNQFNDGPDSSFLAKRYNLPPEDIQNREEKETMRLALGSASIEELPPRPNYADSQAADAEDLVC